jgi:hypothetical protein
MNKRESAAMAKLAKPALIKTKLGVVKYVITPQIN